MNKPIKVIPTPLIYEDYWLTCRELFNSHKQPDWDKLHKLRKTYIMELVENEKKKANETTARENLSTRQKRKS